MELAVLGSGSKGNCSLVKSDSTIIMVDCGFGIRQTESRLADLGLTGADISALLVTHEHSDHIGGAAKFANKYQTPLYMTHGTRQYFDDRQIALTTACHEIYLEQVFDIADIAVMPVPVPHDAKEPCQFVFESDALRFGVLSDIGHISYAVREAYSDCDVLYIECNHDREMLSQGPYPDYLKQRVRGDWGHLSNCQTASFVNSLRGKRLRQLFVGHISEQNNSDECVKAALADIDFLHSKPVLALQHSVQQWVSLAS